MITTIRNLVHSKDLLLTWTSRTIQARYQQSVLGWIWAVIQPVAQAVIFTVIFTFFVPINTGDIPYIIFAYSAMVPWTLLASSLPDMSGAIVGNMSLVTKIYFPREILPIAAVLARLIDFGVAAVLLAVLIIIFRMPIYPPGLFFLPIILAIQLMLIIGLGLASAGANVFFRDIQPLLVLVIQLWFYASPIIYPVTSVPPQLLPFYFLNPMAGILVAYRDVLLYGRIPGTYLIPSAIVALIIFLGGYWFFKRVEYLFADIV